MTKEIPDMYIEPEEQDIPKEEFDLSGELCLDPNGLRVYKEKHVKEFIRLLKEEFTNPGAPYHLVPNTAIPLFDERMVIRRIDKLAGNKLK